MSLPRTRRPQAPFYFHIHVLRRVLAWLPLRDLSTCVAASRQCRYAAMSPIVCFLHARDVGARVAAAALARRVCTDQNSAQDLAGANAVLSLVFMLQEGRGEALVDTPEGSLLRDTAVRTLRCTTIAACSNF